MNKNDRGSLTIIKQRITPNELASKLFDWALSLNHKSNSKKKIIIEGTLTWSRK